MNAHYEVTAIASEGYRHEDIRKREGIRTIPLRIERKISLGADIVSLYRLYRLFKKEKPFIVHSITPKAGLLSMMAAYLAGRTPSNAHLYGPNFSYTDRTDEKIAHFF